MGVPYTFSTASQSIPLSQLDANFATPITLGSTTVALGQTVTTITGLTLANVNITGGTTNINASQILYTQGSSNSVTRTVTNKLQELISVKDFGAVGDGVTDDTVAIQNAINFAMYFNTPSVSGNFVNQGAEVFIPAGKYLISDTIQLGYGVSGFNQIILTGETSYGTDSGSPISGIIPNFVDRPAINIQGCRRPKLRNLVITGKNLAWLNSNYSSITDTSVVANWYGPNISASNNTRYAPYAGVTIDAYSNARPTVSYPDVTYPSFLGTVAQYNKNYSSSCVFENVDISGFVVGIMQAPYAGTSGNGDFTTIKDSNVSFNVVNYAAGNSDSRNVNIINSRLHFAQTAIDGVTYGGQNMFTSILCSSSSFDNVYQLLNVETDCNQISAGGQAMQFDNCYSEVMRTFGNIHTQKNPQNTQAPGVIFNSCKFNFIYTNQEYSPNYILNGQNTVVEFNNTLIQGGYRFSNFNCIVTGSALYFDRGLDAFGINDTPQSASVASSYTCTFLANSVLSLNVVTNSATYFDFGGFNFGNKLIESDGLDINYTTTYYYNQRGLVIPHFVKNLREGRSTWSLSGLDDITLNRATYNLSSLTKTTSAAKYKNEYTFTVVDTFISDKYGSSIARQLVVNSGDIMIDQTTGYVYFVVGITYGTGTISLRVRQLTGIRNSGTSGSPVWDANGTMSGTTGTLQFKNSRFFYPTFKRIVATSASGAATLTCGICGSEATTDSDIASNTLFLPLATTDYIISTTKAQSPQDSVYPYGQVSSANSTTGVITLSENARRNYYGDVQLFVKGAITGTAP